MFARHRQLFATAVFVTDGLLIAGSWLAAYWLRFYGLGLPAPLAFPPLSLQLWIAALLTPSGLLAPPTFRIYRSARTAGLSHELGALLKGVIVITALDGPGPAPGPGE